MYLCCLSTRRRRAVYIVARLFSWSRPLRGCCAAPARPREPMPVREQGGSRARATSGATQRVRQPFAGFNARMLTRRTVYACAASQVHQACPSLCLLVSLQALALRGSDDSSGPRLHASEPWRAQARRAQNRRPGERPQRHQYQLAPVARGTHGASRTRTPAAAGRSHSRTRGPGTNRQPPAAKHGRHQRPARPPASPASTTPEGL